MTRKIAVALACAVLLGSIVAPGLAAAAQTGVAHLTAPAGVAQATAQTGVAAAPPKTESSAPLAPASIYQLESRWTRAGGDAIALAALRGKVRVLAIFYSSCQYACPIIVGRMKSIQAGLPAGVRSDAGFVLVSMDPSHDDPAALRDYAKRMELEGDWTLLHGSDGDVRELAALLGFRYRQEKDGGFSHSNMITVLDREGRVAHQSIGLDNDVGDSVRAVTSLLVP